MLLCVSSKLRCLWRTSTAGTSCGFLCLSCSLPLCSIVPHLQGVPQGHTQACCNTQEKGKPSSICCSKELAGSPTATKLAFPQPSHIFIYSQLHSQSSNRSLLPDTSPLELQNHIPRGSTWGCERAKQLLKEPKQLNHTHSPQHLPTASVFIGGSFSQVLPN